jgi:sugar phosphate permease
VLTFFVYGSFIAIQSTWGGPYLMDLRGFSALTAGNILLGFAIGRVVAPLLYGSLSDRLLKTRKWLIIPTVVCYAGTFLWLTGLIPIASPVATGVLFFSIAFFGATIILLYAQIKEIFPPQLSGLVTTSLNFFTMIGGAVVTQLIGYIVQQYPQQDGTHPPEAYHAAFGVCLVSILVALVFYTFSKEARSHE